MKIRGLYNLKKPEIPKKDIRIAIGDIANTTQEILDIKENLSTINNEIDEFKNETAETLAFLIEKSQEEPLDENELEEKITENVLSKLPKIENGRPGKDAKEIDTDKIVEEVLAQIPEPQKIDENKLLTKLLKQIPNKKGDLKIIQEKIETDPLSVIDEIMKLPEDKFKLKSSQIDGLDQTIRAFQSQLSRGYLHGGGLTKVSTDNTTITGDGTPNNPLTLTGGSEDLWDLSGSNLIPHSASAKNTKIPGSYISTNGSTFAYDANDNITTITDSYGRIQTFTYTTGGLPNTIADGTNTWTFSYNANDLITNVTVT